MTPKAERFIELLALVKEACFQDGRAMGDPDSTHERQNATLQIVKNANYDLIEHLRNMTAEDLKSL